MLTVLFSLLPPGVLLVSSLSASGAGPAGEYSHIPNRRTYTFIYFRNIAVLYGLIRVYTFIRFVSNPAYTIFIWSMFMSLNIFNIFEVILR